MMGKKFYIYTYNNQEIFSLRQSLSLQYSPSAVFTIPLFLLFNLVAFQTFNISAGAIEAAKLPGKEPSAFFRLSNRAVGVVGEVFEVGGGGGE